MPGSRGKVSTVVYCILLIIFIVPAVFPWTVLFTGQKTVSDEENRTLTRFPALTVKGFLDGSFQEDFENALADQNPGGRVIKKAVLDAEDAVSRTLKSWIYGLAPELRSSYDQITEGYYHYAGDLHRIVERPKAWREYSAQADAFAQAWAGETDVPKYLYFIENSRVTDFDRMTEGHDIAPWIAEIIGADDFDIFSYDSYSDFCTLFYQTDHHWNPDGADAGYRAVIRMLCGGDEPLLSPNGTVDTSVVFQGSYARQTREMCADELFWFYTYDVPRMTVLVNGKKGTYGRQAVYQKGRYPTDEMRDHYSYCFGGNPAQLEYLNPESDNGTLLVIASSYSNAIAPLIASHFSRTIYIDPRYYRDWAGSSLDLQDFCSHEKVDKVLYLGDVAMFLTDTEEKGEDAD